MLTLPSHPYPNIKADSLPSSPTLEPGAFVRMTTSETGLPEVLPGQRRSLQDQQAGLVSFYVLGPEASSSSDQTAPPMLLIHSINASASAHEVEPLYKQFSQSRRTYAIDLPGFGHSERSERTYDQDLMVNAIIALIDQIQRDNNRQALDVLAVSLSCEFLAKAALRRPDAIRSLALVSPTGFARYAETKGPPEANCGRPGVLKFFKLPVVGSLLFKLLTSKVSIRFFLRKTWGSKHIDESFFQTSLRMRNHPGAEHAPFHFISGYLFSADILTSYLELQQPVWLAHGTRGDFNDYSRKQPVESKGNWQISEFDTGALPYFEIPDEFLQRYRSFLKTAET